MTDTFEIPVTESDSQPEVSDDLVDLYRGFEREYLNPLWTEIGDLMPTEPRSKARPHLWRWADLVPLAARAWTRWPSITIIIQWNISNYRPKRFPIRPFRALRGCRDLARMYRN